MSGLYPVCNAPTPNHVQVHAYSVEFGRQLGRWQAHDDAVSCLQLMSGDQLLTGSWDCSLKLWQ